MLCTIILVSFYIKIPSRGVYSALTDAEKCKLRREKAKKVWRRRELGSEIGEENLDKTLRNIINIR